MGCTIFLTEHCNLKCSSCYQGIKKENTNISIINIGNSLDYIIKKRYDL